MSFLNVNSFIYFVPWGVTTTFGAGTETCYESIRSVYHQLDNIHPFLNYLINLQFIEPNQSIIDLNNTFYLKSKEIINDCNTNNRLSENKLNHLKMINQASIDLNNMVYSDTLTLLNQKKRFILCGGEHGVGIGYVKALSERYQHFSVLQIDSHMDCRQAYFGFHYSHASVMTHYSSFGQIDVITQVGIRDYDQSELEFQQTQSTNFNLFTDYSIHKRLFEGESWSSIVDSIINTLSENVFISLDIDGLMAYLCPNTGTPVPGGLSYNQLLYLFERLYHSNKVIGAEVIEVNNPINSTWDSNVGARLLQVIAGLLA